MPEISFRSLAEQCAPTPEDVELSRHIWNYHVWGYSIDMIADTLQNVGFSTNRTAVQRALKEMKSRMEGASYRELAEGEVRAIEATSSEASSVETATYLATEPKPGQLSVIGRSLSTVLGMPMQAIG